MNLYEGLSQFSLNIQYLYICLFICLFIYLIEYMNIKTAQVHDRSFWEEKKNLIVFFISSITLYLTIIVRQHCKCKFKCTLVIIINIHVTCGGGGGGSFCLMDLGLFLIIWTWAILWIIHRVVVACYDTTFPPLPLIPWPQPTSLIT